MQLREAASPAPPWTRAHPAAVQKADPARRYPRRPCLHRFACFQNRSAVAVPGGQTAPEQTAAAQYSSVIVLSRLLEVQAAPVRQLQLHKPLHCGNLPGPDGFHPVCPLWFPGAEPRKIRQPVRTGQFRNAGVRQVNAERMPEPVNAKVLSPAPGFPAPFIILSACPQTGPACRFCFPVSLRRAGVMNRNEGGRFKQV